MAYLHQLGVVHRDLKADNILCMKNADDARTEKGLFTVKIVDFGLSAIVPTYSCGSCCGGCGDGVSENAESEGVASLPPWEIAARKRYHGLKEVSVSVVLFKLSIGVKMISSDVCDIFPCVRVCIELQTCR